jgi:hypothetical protein
MGGIVVGHGSVLAPFHICPTVVSSHADMISICTFIREENNNQCQRILYVEHNIEELLSFLLLEYTSPDIITSSAVNYPV